ncbi:MAG: glycosyltransferase family 4 protein [Methanobacterium sp.]
MTDVLFIRSNPVSPDPRVQKEAKSLSKNGYKVKVLAWDRTGKLKKKEKIDNYFIKRFKLKAPYGKPELILKFFLWNFYELIFLLSTNYDIIHSCDFDTLLPAFIAAKIRNKKLIYDCFDFYADSLPLIVPSYIRSIIASIEIFLAKRADIMILPESIRVEQFNNELKNPLIIYNSPYEYKPTLNGHNNGSFDIFFAGAIYEGRGIENIISAAEGVPDVQITIAGYEVNGYNIGETFRGISNVNFLGKIEYEEVLERTSSSDLIFALYDPKIPNHIYSSPNKLFEAMMCQKPILVSKGTSMVNKVDEHKCGVSVDYNNIKGIKNSIIYLKDNPKVRLEMGLNGRIAYEQFYSWDKMEKRLLDAYKNI